MSLFKDSVEIWRILFDHQPFIHNQINLFVKEFEEKRLDREVDNILDTLNILCEIKDVQCERLKSAGNIGNLTDSIKDSLDVANSILKESQRYPSVAKLEAKKFRELELESFKQELDNKYLETNAQFERENERLKNYYKELKTKK